MPYLSRAQARRFHADPKLRKYAKEWDQATDFSKLPERVGKRRKSKKRNQLIDAIKRGGR